MFREEDFRDDLIAECAYEIDNAPLNLLINIEREILKRNYCLLL